VILLARIITFYAYLFVGECAAFHRTGSRKGAYPEDESRL